jgi:hypothetical protein
LLQVGRESLDRDLASPDRELSRLAGTLAARVGGTARILEEAVQQAEGQRTMAKAD